MKFSTYIFNKIHIISFLFKLGLFSFFFFFLVTLGQANPTTSDSVSKKTEVKWVFLNQLAGLSDEGKLIEIENINGFQHYEFSRKANFFSVSKGNVGHSARPLEFQPSTSNGFMLYANEPFFGNNFSKESLKFYEPDHVFTDLYYVSGPNREQTLNVLHNQRLSEGFILGLNYRVINSPGRYSRTASANTNWYANFKYSLPRKRYGAIGGFIANRVQNQESGGLRNRLEFEQNRRSDAGILSNAELQDRETVFFVHQFYKTGGASVLNNGDSLLNKSVNVSGKLFHDLSISRRSISFFDKSSPNNEFFGLQPLNSKETHDSTTVFVIENSAGYMGQKLFENERKLTFKGFLKHWLVRINQNVFLGDIVELGETQPTFDYYRHRFGQILTGVDFAFDLSGSVSVAAKGNYIAFGKNKGDLSINSILSYNWPKVSSIMELRGGYYLEEAPYLYSNFLGNYVSWQTEFDKQSILHAGLGFENNLFHLSVNAYLLQNMVFMGSDILPVQNPNSFGLVSVRGGISKSFGAFNTGHEVLLQYAGTEDFERFPLLTSYHTFFFEFSLFKQAMFLNVGFDLFYNTPYQPMSYMPVVRQFYSQNGYRSDHVITADFFGTFRIGRARLFLKAHNIGSEIPFIPVVYQVPFYPLQDFAVKFGVSWLFFD